MRRQDPEEGRQDFLFLEEDMAEMGVDREVDEQCREDVVDGRRVHCREKAWGSTLDLEVACWRLEEDGSCVTVESRVAAYGGCCLVVEGRRDWVFRASDPRHRLLPCSSFEFESQDNDLARTSFVSIPRKTWYRGCTMTYGRNHKVARDTGMVMAVRWRADSPRGLKDCVIEQPRPRE